MARCEKGYLCEVCGQEVEEIFDSGLYLRFVLGDVDPEKLHLLPERHIRCDAALAQYIVDGEFAPVVCEGLFGKSSLDAEWVAEEEQRVTRGWKRLREAPTLGIPIEEYPLPEAKQRWSQ